MDGDAAARDVQQLAVEGVAVRLRLRGEPIVRVVPVRSRRAKSPGPEEYCRRSGCIDLRQQLKQARGAATRAQNQYDDLHRRWRLEVEGAVRGVSAELAVVQEQLRLEMRLHSEDNAKCAHVSKELRLTEQERSSGLVAECAQLKAELASARHELGLAARRDRSRVLSERKAERVRADVVAAAQRKSDKATAAAGNKLSKAKAANYH